MNDRYLFKAKRTDNGEWVKGYYRYIQCLDEHHILPINPRNKMECYVIDPSTVCQCAGYAGIWEHDIFQCDEERYQIEFDGEELTWQAESLFYSDSIELGEFSPDEIDVIGNIFDNPELLGVIK